MPKDKIIEFKSKDNGSLFTIDTDAYPDLGKEIFDEKAHAENAIKVYELKEKILKAMPPLSEQGADFLAKVSHDRGTQLKVVLNEITKYLDEREPPSHDDYPFDLLTANVKGSGLAETLIQFYYDEGHRDFTKDIDFLRKACEAMEEAFKTTENVVEPEPATE